MSSELPSILRGVFVTEETLNWSLRQPEIGVRKIDLVLTDRGTRGKVTGRYGVLASIGLAWGWGEGPKVTCLLEP